MLSSIGYKLTAIIVWEKELAIGCQILDSFLEQEELELNFENWERFGIGGHVTEENSRQEEELEGTKVGKDRECSGNSY